MSTNTKINTPQTPEEFRSEITRIAGHLDLIGLAICYGHMRVTAETYGNQRLAKVFSFPVAKNGEVAA